MKKNKTGTRPRRRRWPIVLICVLLVLGVLAFLWREPIRMIWYSNVDPQNPLNVEGTWEGGETYAKVRYSEVSENQWLDLYVPNTPQKPRLIVLVHGGGFIMNDAQSRQAQLFYQYFRDHGYACATVNYRLAQEAIFPAAVQDVKCAIRFLRANAGLYGYDAQKITVWGESAGGYLAVMAGVTAEDEFSDLPFIGEEALAEPVSGHVDVVLDYYGAVRLESKADRAAAFAELGVPAFVVDIANSWLSDGLKDMPGVESCEDAWIGKPIGTLTPEELNAVSPMYYAEKNLSGESDLRMLILHGDADITVPWTQSRDLAELLTQKLGAARVDFRLVRNAKHADEDLYSDPTLGEVENWLSAALSAD